MAPSSPNTLREGIFAINKPLRISSAQVIRDAQSHFKDSDLFKPWLDREQARKDDESHNQRQKRRSWKQRQPLQVKIGHGGTLDPMATGVLILGVGNGTKSLGNFLGCTKSYEAVILFGAATDTYDAVGKIVARKGYDHVTRDRVEEALQKFRGAIMQRPPIYSALRVKGKHLYEYAREGKEVPVEIQERPVEVENLEMSEWMEGGTHSYHWPMEEAPSEEKEVVGKMLYLDGEGNGEGNGEDQTKRKRDESVDNDDPQHLQSQPLPKRRRPSQEAFTEPSSSETNANTDIMRSSTEQSSTSINGNAPCPAPACRLRMTVTSGFYVRSLCHDLGAAVNSLGLMASLVRTRQGEYELGKNVLEYEDLAKGEDVWGPQVEGMLKEWTEKDEESRSIVPGKEDSEPAMRAKPRENMSRSGGEEESS